MSMKLRSKISAALVAFGIIPSVIVAAVTFYTAWTLKRNQAFLITETARAGAHSIERQMRQTAVGVKPSTGTIKPDSPPAGTGPANSTGNQIASAYAEVSQQLGDYGIKRPQVMLVEGNANASGATWNVVARQGENLTDATANQAEFRELFKDAFKNAPGKSSRPMIALSDSGQWKQMMNSVLPANVL